VTGGGEPTYLTHRIEDEGSSDRPIPPSRLGEPTTIEVFDGETSLGIYSHEQGRPIN
jgi:hypothetical protein